MKHIGLLLIVIILSACQNNEHTEVYDTHIALNEALIVLESENIALKNQLRAAQNPASNDEIPADAGGYLSVIDQFVSTLTPELARINQTLNATESHSIALAYEDILTAVQNINQTLDALHTEIEAMSLSESQDIHFAGLREANEELRAGLEVLRRGVEINNFTQVQEALEDLSGLNNNY